MHPILVAALRHALAGGTPDAFRVARVGEPTLPGRIVGVRGDDLDKATHADVLFGAYADMEPHDPRLTTAAAAVALDALEIHRPGWVTVTMINRGAGGIQVHRQGCADTRRSAWGAAVWDTTVSCYADVVRDIYPPSDFDYSPDEWPIMDADITVMPCCPGLIRHAPGVDA